MDLGNVKIGLGVESSQFTSGISKAVGDLTRLAEGLKKTGLQGVEPLQRKIEAFQKTIATTPQSPMWSGMSAEIQKTTSSLNPLINKLIKFKETNKSAWNAMSREGAPTLQELAKLEKALVEMTSSLSMEQAKNIEGVKKSTSARKEETKVVNEEVSALQKLQQALSSGSIFDNIEKNVSTKLAQIRRVAATVQQTTQLAAEALLFQKESAQHALVSRSTAPLNFLPAMSGASTGSLTLGGSSLGKSVQQEVMLGEVFGRSPNKSVISLMTQEVEKLTRSLSDIGLREGITPIIDKFTALGQRVKNLQIEILTLNKEIAAGIAKEATAEQAAAGRIAQQKLLAGYGAGGFISAGVKDIQIGLTAAAGDIKQATYQNLRKDTDDLIQSTKNLGTSQLELGIKGENLRTAMGNINEMVRTGKGDISALNDEHKKLGVEVAANDKLVNKFNESGKRMGMNIKSLIQWQIEWYFTQNLIFGLSGILSQGIKNMIDFEQKMANLQAITNSTTADTNEMGKAARQLGINSRMSALEIADGMTILGQAGFSAKETILAMNAVVALSTSTLTDMKISTDLVTTALRAFDLGADQSAKVANVMAASTNYSKLTMEDLKTAFNYVAVIGKQAGLSIEEITATLGALRDRGIQASTMSTGLRGILGTLIAPTARFRAEIEKVGLTMDQVNPRYNEWGDILTRLRDSGFSVTNAFQGMDKRQAGALVAVIQSADAYKRLLEQVTGTNAAFEMQSIQLGTTQSNLLLLKNNIIELSLKISDGLLPPLYAVTLGLKSLVQGINETGNGISSWTKIVIVATTAIVSLTSVIVGFRYVVWPFLSGILGLEGGFTAVTAAISNLKWGFIGITVIIATALTALGMYFYNLNKTKKEMLDLHKETSTSIPVLQELAKEIGKQKDGSKELVGIMDRLVVLYPSLKGQVDAYTGSVKDATGLVNKLTEAQLANYLASVPTKLQDYQEQLVKTNVHKDVGTFRDFREKNKGSGKTLSQVSLEFERSKVMTYGGALEQLQEKESERASLSATALKGPSTFKQQDRAAQLDREIKALKEYKVVVEGIINLATATHKAGGEIGILSPTLEKLGVRADVADLAGIKPPAKAGKETSPATPETDREIADRLRAQRYAITNKEQFDKRMFSLTSETTQLEIAALHERGKEKEAVEKEYEIRRLQSLAKQADEIREVETKMQQRITTKGDAFYNPRIDDYRKSPAAVAEVARQTIKISEEFLKQRELIAQEGANKLTKIEEKQAKDILDLRVKFQKDALALEVHSKAAIVTYNTNARKEAYQLEQETLTDEINALKEQSKYQIDSLRVRGKLLEVEEKQHTLNMKKIENDELNELEKIAEKKAKLLLQLSKYPREHGDMSVATPEENDLLKVYLDTSQEDATRGRFGRQRIAEDFRSLEEQKKARGKTPMEGLQVGLSNMSTKFGTFGDQIETFTETGLRSFSDGMAEAFTSFVDGTKSAKEAFKDFTKSFLQEILKQINAILAMQAVKAMVGLATTAITNMAITSSSLNVAGSASTGWESNYAAGSYATGGVVPGRMTSFRRLAGGGITSRPMLALVGDNKTGRELVIPEENIKEDSVSGYTRDKNQSQGVSILNVMDPSLVPQLVAANPDLIVNIINADVVRRGVSYQNIKQVSRR